MPSQDAIIEPERQFEEAAGANSHFDPNPDDSKPAVFRLRRNQWKSEIRANAAITVVHETWPGHHLQIAFARDSETETPLSKIVTNSAYVEGWARYAEGLAEEAGITIARIRSFGAG